MVTASYIHADTSILMSNVHSKIELVAKLATPAAYRIMQRSSSCKEPRHPLPKVLFFSSVMFVYVINLKNNVCSYYETDPTAGSPTVTLLRLLLPLDIEI